MVNVGYKEQAMMHANSHHSVQNQHHYQHHQHHKQQQPIVQQQQQQNIEQKNHSNLDKSDSKENEALNQQTNGTNTNLANTREKTPMCLVNELARFNKIQHQYRLTNEQGPAHKKRFTVTLMLGEEEYVAEGASIKKAQHSAANEALYKTWYRKPPPKPTRATRIPGKCPAGSGVFD